LAVGDLVDSEEEGALAAAALAGASSDPGFEARGHRREMRIDDR
jgi:hypothetical protein